MNVLGEILLTASDKNVDASSDFIFLENIHQKRNENLLLNLGYNLLLYTFCASNDDLYICCQNELKEVGVTEKTFILSSFR